VGSNILGVQFHPEVSPVAGIEPWLVGHAVELSSAGIDPRACVMAQGADSLPAKARDMFTDWLQGLQL